MPRGMTVKIPTADGYAIERKMITREHRLTFATARCIGCDICAAICPPQAIRLMPGQISDGRLSARPTVEVDPARCSFCGECVALCPTHALQLTVDGQARVPVWEMDVFPRLGQEAHADVPACRTDCGLACHEACPRQAVTVRTEQDEKGRVRAILAVEVNEHECTYCTHCALACPSGAFAVVKPWRGRIHLDTGRCPEHCRACADLCPHRALAAQDDGHVALDERLCTYCGACQRVCPSEGALTVQRSSVRHAPIRSGAWFEALEKLVSPVALAQELDGASQARRRAVVRFVPGAGEE
jgi:4Fe-4S ferredoxin